MKGLPAIHLRTVYSTAEVLKSLRKHIPGISKYRVQLLRTSQGKYTEVILYIDSITTVQQVYHRGVIYEAQIFNTELYYTEAQVHYYFHYYTFGYIAKFYRRTTRYRHCTAIVHQGGEAVYPEKEGSRKKQCINYSSRYEV